MASIQQAVARVLRQLASRRGAGLNNQEQIIEGLRIAAGFSESVPLKGQTQGCSGFVSEGAVVRKQTDWGRGFATSAGGDDQEVDAERMKTIRQLFADLNLNRAATSLAGKDPKATAPKAPEKQQSKSERGAEDRTPSAAASDDGSSSSSSSSDSDSDDEMVSEDEWRSKISEWEERAEPSTAQPHKFSGYVYKEDGTRIDDNSPVKLEDFLPPPGALPSFMKDVHGHMPPGERSMESMLTKMDLDEVEGLPPLEEILAVPAWEKAEAKRLAREKELKKQLEQAASRVRTVDEFGRSHAVGKRKCSVARIWLKQGDGQVTINGKPHVDYFAEMEHRLSVLQPFFQTSTLGSFNVRCLVNGGGLSGQSQAIRHGISKALQLFDPGMRPPLRSAGLLTRDPRVVERKKPGKAKARKSFQWVKR